MPKIKIDKVISFSSEDSVHVAANILSPDPSKKWKCRTPGEKCNSIVLQLQQACIISGIDIGNEHSAYIEVLVNRSVGDEDYKMLLVMSSFMTPLECRQSQNVNKVRMFTVDQLSKPESEEKWDRVKIVCTQPFNKHVQYGLSFVTLHSGEEKEKAVPASAGKQVGKFSLRPESPDGLAAGALFARRKELSESSPVTAAAAIRKASLNPSEESRVKSPIVKKPTRSSVGTEQDDSPPRMNRNRNEILYTKEDEDANEKIDTIIEKKRKEDQEKKIIEERESQKKKEKPGASSKASSDTPKKKTAKVEKGRSAKKNDDVAGPSTGTTNNGSKKRKTADSKESNKRAKVNKNCKPFRELLKDVTLVISGIQNPERANLRTMALSMGARYKPDWDPSCTHLICAFRNTPKFNQVKGKGKIVTRKWIMDCHSQRKRLPWRRYALDPNDQTDEESEEEISEKTKEDNDNESSMVDNGSDTEDEIERIQARQERNKVDESKGGGSDTEDEIERIQALTTVEESTVKATVNGSYGTTHGFENESGFLNLLPKFKSFFQEKLFFVDELLDETTKKQLTQYIVAYKGKIEEASDKINVVLTSEEGVHDLKEHYTGGGTFVVPDWVWECHNNSKLMPMDDFILK